MVRFYSVRENGITSLSALLAAVAELADALDSKSSGAIRAGSSPASGIAERPFSVRRVFFI